MNMRTRSIFVFTLLVMAASLPAATQASPPALASPWESMILSTPAPIGECHDPSQFPLGVPPDFSPDNYHFVFSSTVTFGADCTVVLTGGLQLITVIESI